jgi:hypothetical protein
MPWRQQLIRSGICGVFDVTPVDGKSVEKQIVEYRAVVKIAFIAERE